MKNHWCSYDTTDPLLVWELRVPASSSTQTGSEQEQVIDAVCRAGRATGVVDWIGWSDRRVSRPILERRSGEWLPFEAALFAGARVPFISTVFVRDARGAVHPQTAGDAGALLRELEPDLDAAYLRRFAASHPFIGLFSTSTETDLAVHVCFFCNIYFDESDAELFAANQAPLLKFREALLTLARQRGGTLTAPTTTTAPTATTTTSTTKS